MARIRKRESAKRDLIAQWVWYAENAGIETADRFLAAADSTATMLASQPEGGYRVFLTKPELKGMRRFHVTDGFEALHLFYFPLEDGIDLIRVVHGSQDLQRVFNETFLSTDPTE